MLKRLLGDKGPMGVKISGDAVKRLVRRVVADLKAKRLWPVALGLLVAVVAVPVLLSKSSSSSAQPPAATLTPSPPGLPAITQRGVTASSLHGSSRNPFAPQQGGTSTTPSTGTPGTSGGTVTNSTGTAVTTAGGTSTTSGGSSTSGGSNSGGSSSSSGGNGSGGNGSGGNGSGPTPPPAGLTARQSYAVKLAISNGSGGIDTVDPLQRLTVLPSEHQPLMVELGVLKGGNRVLFALEPGTTVSGPGQCIPGPIYCQIVSVARNQVEHLGVRGKTGISQVALFAVTGISIVTHASVSGAQNARLNESAAGRALLSHTSLSALSLFHYAPGVGAVVDMRNLTFGVNQ